MKPLRYSVAVVNEGRNPIVVKPFDLSDARNATVAVGKVMPSGRKSMSTYYCRPAEELIISWLVLDTGEEKEAQAEIGLPKEFTRATGRAIVLHVNPDKATLQVSYELLDPGTGRARVVENLAD